MKSERKFITILFADIVRSSDIIRSFDSEMVEDLFSQVVGQQIEITKKFRGTVNQVMGDGIMCLFGAEAPYEDHALRAVSAAQEMLLSIAEIQKQIPKARIQIRIGINTGEVMLSSARNENYRAVFRATGEAVYIADRALKKADANQALISEHSKKFLDRHFVFKKIRPLRWDEAKAPLHLYAATAPKLANPLHVPRQMQKSVQRLSAEKRLIALAAASEKGKKSKTVWLWGAAGVGKTHLINSFVQKYCTKNFKKIIQINFYPDPLFRGGRTIDQALIEGLLDRDKLCIPAHLPLILKTVKTDLPFLEDCIKEILNLENMSEAYAALGAGLRQRLRLEAAAGLLLSLAQNDNILLILEDVHWAQEDALDALRRILELHEGSERLLILATSRKEPAFDRALQEEKINCILLEPMTSGEGFGLLKKLDVKKSLSPAIRKRIYQLSGGNPFFIHEYFSWTQASITQGLGRAALKKHLDRHTPGRVADILYNKLVTAGKEIARTAKIASILGMSVNFDVLMSLGSLDREIVLSHLARLEDLGVLQKRSGFPAREWVFTHELLQKVIYNSIPQSERAEWHAAVITQLKKPALKSMDNRYLVMASHAAKTNNDLLKYIYSKWAAREENRLSRYKACISLSAASRQALGRITGRAGLTRQEIKARLFEISNLFMTGQYAHVRKHLDLLLKRKSILISFGKLAETLSYHELYLWIKGDLLGAVKTSRAILSLDIKDRKHETFIREHNRLGSLYVGLGQYKKTIEHNEILLRAIPDEDSEEKYGLLVQPRPGALSRLAEAYAELGQLKKSRDCFDAAYAFLEKTRDYFTRIYIIVHLTKGLLSQDRNQEALRLLQRADEYCRKTDAHLLKPYVTAAYGISLVRLNDKTAGLDLCKQALLQAERNKMLSGKAQFEVWYAEALMAQGDYSLARQQLRRTVVSATRCQEMGNLVQAYTLLGQCSLEKPNADMKSAALYLQRALKLARKWHMKAAENKALALMQKSRINQRLGTFSA